MLAARWATLEHFQGFDCPHMQYTDFFSVLHEQKRGFIVAAQTELLPARPIHQTEYQIVNVSLRELCEQRERFNINPEYQREDVWTRRECQQCIDTILLGRGIGLLEGYKYHDSGKAYWEMMDGHQRMSAVLRFYDNEYKTWTPAVKKRMQPTSQYGPVEPGKYFDQLSQYVKDYFLDYHLPISKTPEMSAEERATRFLCIQCHKSLTPAERLNVFPSKANTTAKIISQHSFWEDFYIGEMGRKQLYLSSLYLLGLQLTPSGMADLRSSPFVPMLASGKLDKEITDEVVTSIQERLDAVSCAYAGMQFTDRAASIAMFQSIMFLEQAGCTIQSSTHKGRLTNWISAVIESSKHASGLPVYHRPIQNLLFASGQRVFWDKHRKTVMTLFGVNAQHPDSNGVAQSVPA